MQGRREGQQRVVAHRCGGGEARLAWGGIREHDAFLGHDMRGPAGTGRGGVLMVGGREGEGAKEEEWGEVPSLAIIAMFCLEFAFVFRLSVSMRTVDNIRFMYSYT